MSQSPTWPRRCLYRFGKSIQRGRRDIDRQIAEAEAQNSGELSKPSTVTDLKIRRWESRPKAGNSSLIKSVRVQANAAQRSAIGLHPLNKAFLAIDPSRNLQQPVRPQAATRAQYPLAAVEDGGGQGLIKRRPRNPHIHFGD